jgi:hypothetical protein
MKRGVLVGTKHYANVAKGWAMGEDESFFKVIVEGGTRRILGAHTIGPHAAKLVQQLVYVMHAYEGAYLPLARAQTIHPAAECGDRRRLGQPWARRHPHAPSPLVNHTSRRPRCTLRGGLRVRKAKQRTLHGARDQDALL